MTLQECRVALPAKEGELSGGGVVGAQMSTVLHISLLQREVMSVSRKHSKIFKWALRRKGVLRWGLVEDIKKGRRLFSGRQF